MNQIDLRSDTVTWPTGEMRAAMASAQVGDDVYGDDPTVNELEAQGARLTGKDAALLVPSGTFGNQLALFTHCPRGTEVILGDDSHIVAHEAGAASVIAGVQLRTLVSREGELDPEEIERRIRTGNDIHCPDTSLICLENAHGSGRALSLPWMDAVRKVADRHGIPVHLDGARLFNAAAALGVDPRELSARADSVMFCLSKGLCAPVGSLLAGSGTFVEAARRRRKLMGGGMRQAGILAAAGLIALGPMRERLVEDHRTAASLAEGLSRIPGVVVLGSGARINMVFARFDFAHGPEAFAEALKARGILANPPEGGILRLVTHYWIRPELVPGIVQAVSEAVSKTAGG
ncbi:MAG TPA: GntG family PLP-dependent aldolase [Magnetospirillaceae bacterium]|nr:GntG family PLP-dependent aldolase [Magnetospirillaceae bacterium]